MSLDSAEAPDIGPTPQVTVEDTTHVDGHLLLQLRVRHLTVLVSAERSTSYHHELEDIFSDDVASQIDALCEAFHTGGDQT